MTLTPSTRASLLLRLRDSRDHEAWLEFVSLYEPVTYRFLRRHGLQDADAREVLQELFLGVSQNIDRWDPAKERGSFRGWLRKVVRNLVLNWLRDGERCALAIGGEKLQLMLDHLPAPDATESVEFDLELRRSLFQRAAELVQRQVQAKTWQAFWETSVMNASATDTAKKLNMSVGAIQVAKCRVFARLNETIRDLENTQ